MGVTFTVAAAQRIAATVRRSENNPPSRAGAGNAAHQGPQEFLAVILSSDLVGRYSFNRVIPAPDQLHPDAFSLIDGDPMKFIWDGDPFPDAAREQNGNRAVASLSIVQMRFAGYDPNGKPVYTFFYPATDPSQGLPPHDHRDNFNGGFSFSVYHPGTDVPQSPFAI